MGRPRNSSSDRNERRPACVPWLVTANSLVAQCPSATGGDQCGSEMNHCGDAEKHRVVAGWAALGDAQNQRRQPSVKETGFEKSTRMRGFTPMDHPNGSLPEPRSKMWSQCGGLDHYEASTCSYRCKAGLAHEPKVFDRYSATSRVRANLLFRNVLPKCEQRRMRLCFCGVAQRV